VPQAPEPPSALDVPSPAVVLSASEPSSPKQRRTAMPRFHPLDGIVHPQSPAGEKYRRRLAVAVAAAGTSPLDLHNFGGKTIPALTFVNLYVGGRAAWAPSDIANIDGALGAAMSDAHLNNMLAQYFNGTAPTTTMLASEVLSDASPPTVGKDTVEGWAVGMHQAGTLAGPDLATTVHCFMLPKGTVLTDGPAAGGAAAAAADPSTLPGDDDAADSKSGLGGFHGSVHTGPDTVYYAVGVYSDSDNGINAFPDAAWKNVVATFYHELNEARTDADVEDAAAAASLADGQRKLGWYSIKGGEIGDIPITEAGADLSKVMVEVPLADGSGTVPIQLLWSDDANGPEGPVDAPLPASKD